VNYPFKGTHHLKNDSQNENCIFRVFFNVFERSLVCSQRLNLFNPKCSKTVILWKMIFNNIPVIEAECSASLLQSSVSHDPSEITLIWLLSMLETVVRLHIFKTCNTDKVLFSLKHIKIDVCSYVCGVYNVIKNFYFK